MRIRFIWPGKTKDERLRSLISEYLKRLSRFVRCEIVETREARTRDASQREKEQRLLLESIPASSLVVLLDLEGRELSSIELAGKVKRWENDSVKEVTVVVGGPEGVTDELRKRAQEKWLLTRLTLTHEMARVLVTEQLYRAYAINHGLPYQK